MQQGAIKASCDITVYVLLSLINVFYSDYEEITAEPK